MDAAMTQGRPSRWRTSTRLLVWAAILSASAVTNALVEVMDAGRRGEDLGLWQPMIWELSSVTMILLTLPVLWWGCQRWPLHADTVFNYDGFYARMKKSEKAEYSDITLSFLLQKTG